LKAISSSLIASLSIERTIVKRRACFSKTLSAVSPTSQT
jgi:hypothetical protein